MESVTHIFECILSYWQQPGIGPYSEQVQSNSQSHDIYLIKIHFNIILPYAPPPILLLLLLLCCCNGFLILRMTKNCEVLDTSNVQKLSCVVLIPLLFWISDHMFRIGGRKTIAGNPKRLDRIACRMQGRRVTATPVENRFWMRRVAYRLHRKAVDTMRTNVGQKCKTVNYVRRVGTVINVSRLGRVANGSCIRT